MNNCPKCAGLMEEGFIADRGDYEYKTVSSWTEGKPTKSFWSGVKTDKNRQIEIKTFRCSNCGYLESFAVE